MNIPSCQRDGIEKDRQRSVLKQYGLTSVQKKKELTNVKGCVQIVNRDGII